MKKKHLFLIPAITMAMHAPAWAQDCHPALKNVATHIDTQAEYVSMNKLSGDLTVLSQYLQLALDTARKSGEEIPEGLSAKKLFNLLGVEDIKAMGLSSTKQDNAWLNRSFIDNGGSGKAIFSLLGGINQEYVVPSICPEGTDLAVQLQLDLRQVEQLVLSVANMVGEDEKVKKNLSKPIPELDITASQLLAKLNVRVNLAIDLDDQNFIPSPFGKVGKPRIVARIDGIAWMWDKIGDKLIANADAQLEKSEANGLITYTLPKQMTDNPKMMGYAPVLVIDKANNHIWISSTAEFLTQCQSGKNTLADSAEFKAAMAGLPAKANSLGYVSKHLLSEIAEKYKNAADMGIMGEDFAKAKPLVDRLLEDITESDKGWSFAISRGEQGISSASRGPLATKHIQYASGLIPLVFGQYMMLESMDMNFKQERAPRRRGRHSE